MSRRTTLAVVAVLLLLALGGAMGYWDYQSSRPAVSAAVFVPPTISVARGDVEQVVSAPGRLVGTREATLSMGMAGRLTQIAVRPGDQVKAGDMLAQIDDSDFRFDLQSAQVALASAQARWRQLQAPPAPADLAAARAQARSAEAAYDAAVKRSERNEDQITVAKAQMEKAAVAVQQAQALYDRIAWRLGVGASPEAVALQQATIDYQAAVANYNLTTSGINDSAVKAAAQALAQARANLARLTRPATDDDLAIAQASVDAAQVTVNQAQSKLAQTQLLAPFAGTVLAVYAKEGDRIGAGVALIQLADPKAVEARVTVVEEDFPAVQVGQSVELFFDARPDLMVKGRVARIVPLRDPSDNPIYPIYITLDSLPAGLAAGMSVDASLLIARRTNVLRLPRALAKARNDGAATVRVWADGRVAERVVQVGLRGNRYVEVVDGLRDGELVVSR